MIFDREASGSHLMWKGRPRGLKPALIQGDLRGPERPLFHGCANILEVSKMRSGAYQHQFVKCLQDGAYQLRFVR